MKNLSRKNAIRRIAAVTRIAGIIALAAIIGFAMFACDNGTTPSTGGSSGTTPGGTTPGGTTPGGTTPGGTTPGGTTPGGTTPTPPTLPTLYENGLWAAALGEVTVTDGLGRDDGYKVLFENPINVSSYAKLILELEETTDGGWCGGQIGSIADNEETKGFWDGGYLNSSGVMTFDLSDLEDVNKAKVDEIMWKFNNNIKTTLKKMYLSAGSGQGGQSNTLSLFEDGELADGIELTDSTIANDVITLVADGDGKATLTFDPPVDISSYGSLVLVFDSEEDDRGFIITIDTSDSSRFQLAKWGVATSPVTFNFDSTDVQDWGGVESLSETNGLIEILEIYLDCNDGGDVDITKIYFKE